MQINLQEVLDELEELQALIMDDCSITLISNSGKKWEKFYHFYQRVFSCGRTFRTKASCALEDCRALGSIAEQRPSLSN